MKKIIVYKPVVVEEGYEWSTKNKWSQTNEETLHPIGDPIWNSGKVIKEPVEIEQKFFWNEYIRASYLTPKEKLLSFANKYGMPRYIVFNDDNFLPVTVDAFEKDVKELQQATLEYEKNGVVSEWVLQKLNKLSAEGGSYTEYFEDGFQHVITNTQLIVWNQFYLDLTAKKLKSCIMCNNPFSGRADKKTCSSACRTALSVQKRINRSK